MTIQTVKTQTPEAQVVRCAIVYADLRHKTEHVNPRGHVQCTEDRLKLFDALDQAERHLLSAVKHLPQCLPVDDVDGGNTSYTNSVVGGEA